jgi:CHAT domain-containing protein
MWSLDEVLRYLPVAALHDGHEYLAEKYRNTVFTAASVAALTTRPDVKAWQELGMDISKSYRHFPPLPAVPKELRRVIREANETRPEGVLPGEVVLDEQFTEASVKRALEHKYPLVQIASHFDFQAGNETNSFLLLGGSDVQGARLTLAEIREDPGITFDDTELLTLSACDTAVGGAGGDGR